jgi:Flp pilus assembly protein TadG
MTRQISYSFVKALRRRNGNVMLEFAIGVGVLVSVFAGTFQYGYTFYQYNLLKNAAMNGASYAAMRNYDSANNVPSNAFSTAVKNVVVYGDPAGGTNPVMRGLTTSNVTLTPRLFNGATTNQPPISMTIAINNYTISAVFGNTTLTNKPSVTYPYQGVWEPY